MNEIAIGLPDDRAELFAALSAAQGEFTNPVKTKTAAIKSKKGEDSSYGYSYADLADVINTIRPTLAKHGLGLIHTLNLDADKLLLTAHLFHKSGQSITSTVPLPRGVDARELGSAITYMRRYTTSALTGIASDDDNDAAGVTAGKSQEDLDRDALTEAMGSYSIGNKALLDAARTIGIAVGKRMTTTETLPYEQIKEIIAKWDDLMVEIQKAAIPGTVPPPAEQPKEEDQVPFEFPPAEKTGSAGVDPEGDDGDMTGIAPELAALMIKDGITPAVLKAYYIAKKHVVGQPEPRDLTPVYLAKITKPANWAKALETMKEGVK